MAVFALAGLLVALLSLLLILHPLRYLLRGIRAVRYKALIPAARVRSAAQGVTEIEGRLDPAPTRVSPLSGMEAGYWELQERYEHRTPLYHAHGRERRFIVLQAEGERFIVDAEHHPLGAMRQCIVVPHLRTGYEVPVRSLKAHLDTLFGEGTVTLQRILPDTGKKRRGSMNPKELAEFLDIPLETEPGGNMTVGEDILLTGQPVRLFGNLRTVRASTREGVAQRVRELGRGWYDKKRDAAAALAEQYALEQPGGGHYTVNLLLRPYDHLPTAVRSLDDQRTLTQHIIHQKLPMLLMSLVSGLVGLTFAPFFIGFFSPEELMQLLDDPGRLAFEAGLVTVFLLFVGGLGAAWRANMRKFRDHDHGF